MTRALLHDRAEPPGLAALAEQVAQERAILQTRPPGWTAPTPGPDGVTMPDVAIIGAGMSGIAAAAGLATRGITKIRLLDQSPDGCEGPWVTTARMETLRSPKHLPGIPAGLPALSFRAWYSARHGEDGWDALYKIPNRDWMDYLTWVRRTLGLTVESQVTLRQVAPFAGHVRLTLADAQGERTLFARRLVLATGRGGAGGLHVPDWIDRSLWPDRAAHTSEAIDFVRLRGQHVAVVGAGPSAWDAAATALEQGAAAVDMYCRRPFLPQVNKGRGNASPAWFEGWGELPVAAKWSLLVYLHDLQAPPPHETVLRTIRQPGFRIHLATPVLRAERRKSGMQLTLAAGERATADFLIVGTGFRIDLARVASLTAFAGDVALWSDRYVPPPDQMRAELGRFPFLGPGFELLERDTGACPGLDRIHLFNHGAYASLGPIASDIPGVPLGADRLARAISQHFFREDFAHIRATLEAFDEPELLNTPFFVPGEQRGMLDDEMVAIRHT